MEDLCISDGLDDGVRETLAQELARAFDDLDLRLVCD